MSWGGHRGAVVVVDTGSVATTPRFSCASRLIPNCADMVRRVHPSIARWPSLPNLTTGGSVVPKNVFGVRETVVVNLTGGGHLAIDDSMVEPNSHGLKDLNDLVRPHAGSVQLISGLTTPLDFHP